MIIYHLAWKSDWERLVQEGLYHAESLESEGFIHCTREPSKLVEVANLFFPQDRGEPLLRLTLETANLSAEVRFEDPGVGHLFPHVYGPIEIASVIAVDPMVQTNSGWELPATS